MITLENARKVLEVVDAGLISGLGSPQPGRMCVEAAVCFALGLPHGDRPICVHHTVATHKIGLNDQAWSSNKARAEGLRKVAVLQLGSKEIDINLFHRYILEGYVNNIFPDALEKDKLKGGPEFRAWKWDTPLPAHQGHWFGWTFYPHRQLVEAYRGCVGGNELDTSNTLYRFMCAIYLQDSSDETLLKFVHVCERALVKCESPGVELWYQLNQEV